MTRLLQNWVRHQAERRPDATAVVMDDVRLSYAALEEASNQLARTLRAAECRRGDRVCLLLPKSPLAIVSMLGVLKADAMYVPVDLSNPAPRVAKIVGSAEPRVILAAGPAHKLVSELLRDTEIRDSVRVGWMECDAPADLPNSLTFSLKDVQSAQEGPIDYRNTPSDAAHILFTSGSTGTPKGVVITHANVAAFVEWAVRYFALGPSDRVSGHAPLHFDLSTFDVYGTFAAGATLHPVPRQLNLLPHRLVEFIRSAELTQWFSVPSVLHLMAKFDVVRRHDFPSLKRLLWCGEVFPTPAVRYWMQRLPHVTFTNLYGPTETTIASSYYTVPRCPESDRVEIPIGRACEGEELLVLSDALTPVAPGEVGELYIGGVGLSPGYWREPEKTRAAFVPDPRAQGSGQRIYETGDLAKIGEDRLVYLLGRADTQIKARGYRIELGEIEAALNALNCLQECAVVAVPADEFEGATICCAYVASPGTTITPATLRTRLATVLPSYMVPERWVAYAELPRNANEKLDRRLLREQFLQG
jgi:amino acid adenylation domain-containing protein